MEVYILDSLYRRTAVVDRFESLIWTERWADIGDFELLLPSNPVNRSIFAPNVYVALNESKRVMQVETIEDNTDAEGRTRLKVKGRSLEKILEDRVARPDSSDTTVRPNWTLVGTPDVIAKTMFNTVCVAGMVDANDIIPLLVEGSAYPAETIPFSTESGSWDQTPASLLSAIKELCDIYKMGFRLYRNGDVGQLFFNIYTGNDRTTQQTTFAPVVFSPGLETIENTTRLINLESAKNVAYVVNEQGFEVVYASDVDLTNLPQGSDRKVLLVTPPNLSIEDVDGNALVPLPEEISAYLIEEGTRELTKNRPLLAFDGEVNQHNSYKYETDYFLGDLVEMLDADGVGNNMRVTEQIFTSDQEGDRAYPTLTIDSFIIPGTWDSWVGGRSWADFGVTEYWNTQP